MKESEAVYKAYHIWKTRGADPLTLYDAFVAGVEYFKTNGGFVIPDTQGEPCHLCGEPIDHFAGNPSKWGTVLSIGYGIPKPHHKGCIQKKLHELELMKAEKNQAGGLDGERLLRSKPDLYEDDVEQLAFELAFELEEADLNPGDLITVNREKLKAIARRIISKNQGNSGL